MAETTPDPIRSVAFFSIARGCGFASLAILTAMLGLSYDPVGALRFGGASSLLVAFVLVLMAAKAESVPYKKTEIWLILDDDDRPDAARAQRVITGIRRQVLIEFAQLSAKVAAAMLVLSVILRMIR